MNPEQIEETLTRHSLWLVGEPGGRRANLRNANLRNANLWNANLRNANLRNANLRNANLWNANLRNANLRNANLRDADLRNANLRNADLRNADLRNADLRHADLRDANLRNANLRHAELPLFCEHATSIRNGKIRVGCKMKSAAEWLDWLDGKEEFETKRNTDEFKRIEAMIRAACTYIETLKNENAKTNNPRTTNCPAAPQTQEACP